MIRDAIFVGGLGVWGCGVWDRVMVEEVSWGVFAIDAFERIARDIWLLQRLSG